MPVLHLAGKGACRVAPVTSTLELLHMRYLYWLPAVMLSNTSVHAGDFEMKEIQYCGGLVTFSVPKNWVEEYDPDGGGMFYENAPDTGTLRLNLITAKSRTPLSDDAAFEELVAMKSVKAESVQRLRNGNAIATSIQRSSEQGQDITIFWWHLTSPVRPSHLRIANFSYTVLTAQERSEIVKREVKILTESIKDAKFQPTLGEPTL